MTFWGKFNVPDPKKAPTWGIVIVSYINNAIILPCFHPKINNSHHLLVY